MVSFGFRDLLGLLCWTILALGDLISCCHSRASTTIEPSLSRQRVLLVLGSICWLQDLSLPEDPVDVLDPVLDIVLPEVGLMLAADLRWLLLGVTRSCLVCCSGGCVYPLVFLSLSALGRNWADLGGLRVLQSLEDSDLRFNSLVDV